MSDLQDSCEGPALCRQATCFCRAQVALGHPLTPFGVLPVSHLKYLIIIIFPKWCMCDRTEVPFLFTWRALYSVSRSCMYIYECWSCPLYEYAYGQLFEDGKVICICTSSGGYPNTCLLSALLFPSNSLQNSQALEFVWYKAEEWVLLSTCGLCAAQGVCVCCGRSTSVLFSYCKPKKLFCLRDWMHIYSQLDYFIQIRHQGIPVVNK